MAALIFSSVMLRWGLSQLSYQGERWGLIGVGIFGGAALLVELTLLLPATVILIALTKNVMSGWFRWGLMGTCVLAIATDVAALGCCYYDYAVLAAAHKRQNPLYTTGLGDAIRAGDEKKVRQIVKADPTLLWECDYQGYPPLILAVRSRQTAIVKTLLELGHDPDCAYYDGRTALHYAAEQGLPEIAKLLIAGGADVNREDRSQKTPLMYARASGRRRMAKLLRDHGGAVINLDAEAIRAVEAGDKQRVTRLLAIGADVNAAVPNGMTLLHFAAEKGHIKLAEFLLAKGAKLEAQAGIGTPLHCAANEGQTEMVRLLISKGANPNAKESRSITPLHWASEAGHLGAVKALLDAGADVSVRNENGSSALDIAKRHGHPAVASLLRQHAAKD